MSIGLYVHIPFCETKCPYCDFNTYASIEALMPGYVRALKHEIKEWGAWLERPKLSSVFFGGGTPSYLPTRDINLLMRAIKDGFDLPGEAEVTLEANPGDCSRERLRAIRLSGINRLSIGVQSLDDNELRLLGRRHSSTQALRSIEAARAAGFENISIDLMFGLPYQLLSSWEHTLDEVTSLDLEHISAYALTLEGGTPMQTDVKVGRLPEPDNDRAAMMYEIIPEKLGLRGLAQYEISNWSKAGFESVHNLTYWRNEAWLGVGPGAHSFLLPSKGPLNQIPRYGVRFAETKPPRLYIDKVNRWSASGDLDLMHLAAAAAIETLEESTLAVAQADTMMMGLRLNEGVADSVFRERFVIGITEAFPRSTHESLDDGLLEWVNGRLRLTDAGRPLGNETFGRFIGEMHG